MGMSVVTVAAGGMPVIDVSGIGMGGVPVTEAANKFGTAVTKVTNGGMPVSFETIGAVAAPLTPTAFNPADLSNVTLTGSNLIATGTGAGGGVRSVASISSGKYYFEYTYTTINTNTLLAGVCLSSFNLTVAGTLNAAGVLRTTGQISINNVGAGTPLGIIGVGNIIGVAVDVTAKLIWFRIAPSGNWNGSGTANPATGTGGLSIAALSGALFGWAFCGVSDKITANFGASTFSGAVPSGFVSGLST